MSKATLLILLSPLLLSAWGERPQSADPSFELDRFSNSVEALTARLSPSVVKIMVTRYGAQEESGRSGVATGSGDSLGSGVIVDSAGYILTNAHVVEGAQKIRVSLMPAGDQTIENIVAHADMRVEDATLIGMFKEGDLALIKIAGKGLHALPFANYDKLRQGEVVFAFGSPIGLQNSVSMGIVSSIARQPDRDSPFIYIQTDTPINPGNSGGPLVNSAGEIVGLNTFILSRSGGNEGVGFAIPSMLLKWVVPQLQKYGHVHRTTIGVGVQAITPVLAAALKLQRTYGVVVSDVTPGSPAEAAGVRLNDIVVSVDGRAMESVPAMLGMSLQHGTATAAKVKLLRGDQEIILDLAPVEESHASDRLSELADSAENVIDALGIVGATVDKQNGALTGPLRYETGIIAVTRPQIAATANAGLQMGDVIHTVNGNFVENIAALRADLSSIKHGDAVALLVERSGQLLYLSFEMP